MKPADERALGQYLAVRERSRGEVARYLAKRKIEASEIETLLSRWEELGILNDASFTATLVRSYLKKGKGPLFIRYKLKLAGIARDDISEAINGISKSELTQAMEKRFSKIESKLATLPAKLKRPKAFAWLSASGFLLEDSSRFIDERLPKE